VCSEYVEGLAAARGLKLKTAEEISAILQCDDCEHFKDRSRFVELPCHTGKTAYAFFSDTKANPVISEGVVIGFEITARRRVLTTICLEDGDTFNGRYEENVFLTKEAAEQALKELEYNA